MGNMQAMMRSLPSTSYDMFPSWKQMPYLQLMSKWEPCRTRKCICNFRATTIFEMWCCHCLRSLCKQRSQIAFVQWGAPLMTLHRKQVCSGWCLRIRTFSSTSPLTHGSPHISIVYNMAGSRAHKCGQALQHRSDTAKWDLCKNTM